MFHQITLPQAGLACTPLPACTKASSASSRPLPFLPSQCSHSVSCLSLREHNGKVYVLKCLIMYLSLSTFKSQHNYSSPIKFNSQQIMHLAWSWGALLYGAENGFGCLWWAWRTCRLLSCLWVLSEKMSPVDECPGPGYLTWDGALCESKTTYFSSEGQVCTPFSNTSSWTPAELVQTPSLCLSLFFPLWFPLHWPEQLLISPSILP